jgi:hypothetical protein
MKRTCAGRLVLLLLLLICILQSRSALIHSQSDRTPSIPNENGVAVRRAP